MYLQIRADDTNVAINELTKVTGIGYVIIIELLSQNRPNEIMAEFLKSVSLKVWLTKFHSDLHLQQFELFSMYFSVRIDRIFKIKENDGQVWKLFNISFMGFNLSILQISSLWVSSWMTAL